MATSAYAGARARLLINHNQDCHTRLNFALQQDALTAAGCERLFSDTISGAKAERPGLEQALACVRAGDTLVVWKLDRLGRSLPHLIATITAAFSAPP